MRVFRSFVFLPIAVLFLLGGCADDPPNPVGIGLVPSADRVKIRSYDTTAISSSTYTTRISGSTTLVMLGKYQDDKAWTLMQFYIDSTKYPLTKLDSVTLSFRINYRFRDSSGVVAFTLHNMRTTWYQGSFTLDSLQLIPNCYSDTILGSYTLTVHPTDSTVSIRLDTSAARTWISNGQSSIILVPKDSSTIIIGIGTVASYADQNPKLTIAYHDTANVPYSDSMYAYQRMSVAENALPVVTQHMFAQGSVAVRSKLKFDVSGIPANVSITEATLRISLDTVLSVRNSASDNSIIALFAVDDSAKPAVGGYYGVSSLSNGSVLTIPVTSLVQQWAARGAAVNHGIVLRAYNEYTTIERYAMYDVTALPALRPKLLIKYSVVR